MDFLLLVAGLAGLWLGTEAAIRGAVAIAERLGVSEFVIGLAVLSIGSDLPELAIAIDAAFKNLAGGDASDLVVGSAIGSSLGQIGFVLGVAGMIACLTLPRRTVFRQGGVLLGSAILIGLFGYDGVVSRTEGLSLVTVYLIYLGMLFTGNKKPLEDGPDSHVASVAKALVHLVIGLAIVIGSAELTVTSAAKLAVEFGVEESFVAIIIIGLGSSLPELSISIAAVLKQRAGMSVGNLIGSNVFDTLVPIGVAAIIAELSFNELLLRQEVPFLFLLTLVALVFFAHKSGIRRLEASVILALYLGYVVFKFMTAPA